MRWFRSHGSRIRALEESFEKLARDHRASVLEAEDLYEKVRAALGRISKRAGLAAAAPPSGSDDDPRLAHLDPVSRAIHIRRGTFRRGLPVNGEEP